MKVTHDLHVHTNLSLCADPSATPLAYLQACKGTPLSTIGFSNHTWAAPFTRNCGWADWYARQSPQRVLDMRREIPADTGGVRVLIGCECEYLGGGVLGMTREAAAMFDYVLVPASHFHQWGHTVPHDFKQAGADAVRRLLLERFTEVVRIGGFFGICHPFIPFGFFECEAEIIRGITDAQYRECFLAAADAGICVEIHHHAVQSSIQPTKSGFSGEYVRMLSIARECGCLFYMGSDAHKPESLSGYERMAAFADTCGIGDANIPDFVKHCLPNSYS